MSGITSRSNSQLEICMPWHSSTTITTPPARRPRRHRELPNRADSTTGLTWASGFRVRVWGCFFHKPHKLEHEECQPSACTPIEHYCSESCMDTGLLGPLEQVQGIPSFIETVSIPALGVEADTLNAVPRGSTITEIVEFTHMQS